MQCQGIRGAITVTANGENEILEATRELLARIVALNGLEALDIASALFTATPDLTAAFPSQAARDMGWQHVPLLNAQELAVPGALSRCVRVLIHWNTGKGQEEVQHVYLRGATSLRPDLLPKGNEA